MSLKNLFRQPIAIALSPNSSLKDAGIALSYLIFPWKWLSWRQGKKIPKLENEFKKYLPTKFAFTFDSGRSGLLALLKCLDIGKGDEVLLQAYTCVVVPNAVLFAGAKPVYVDLNPETFNFDLKDLTRKITQKTRAIIIQHTFGHPAPLQKILSLARQYNFRVIEDCAHSLGSEYQGRKLGTWGDGAMFSFGRDKVISCVHGGIVVTNNSELASRLKTFQKKLSFPRRKLILQHLLHPIIFTFLVIPFYHFFHLGKIILFLSQKIGLLSKVLTKGEKKSLKPANHPAQLPNALTALALSQLKRLKKFNEHRIKLADFYTQALQGTKLKLPPQPGRAQGEKSIFLRYTIQTPRAAELLKFAKKHRILLGDWYNPVIAPPGVDFLKAGYQKGSCPRAEEAASFTVNLPTHHKISFKDAERIVNLIKEFLKS